MRLIVPGLKFSATMAKCPGSAGNRSRPWGALRSMPTLRLRRLLRRNVARAFRPVGSTIAGSAPRPDSPSRGCSTLTTSAPRRARSWVPNGSACICSAARTRTPSRGLPYRWASGLPTSPSFIGRMLRRTPHCACQVRSTRPRPDGSVKRERRETMQGILSASGDVPYRRLDRSAIARTFGSGGGRGTRAVSGYNEDTTTVGVEAARLALRSAPDARPRALWFATVAPAYLDKTNAATIHAALRLDRDVPAADVRGPIRPSGGALHAPL